MSNSLNIRLLIIEESSSDAESLANELKNAGHCIELAHASDTGSLQKSLAAQTPDILICGSGADLPDAASVKSIVDQHESSIPVIAIADEASEDTVVAARKAGITALVSYDRPEHLHVVFKQEVEIIELRHRLESFTATLHDSEKRCHALIENSSDAIAYIHDGMHVYANRPYLDLFDIKTKHDVDGLPILDMITNNQRDEFKDFLKGYNNNDDAENTLKIDCISPRGEPFNSTMELSPATMDGETCTQIVIRVNSTNNSDLEKKIKTLSQQDMLTGLWNRQHFMRLLKDRVSSDTEDGMHRALIYMTLDNFKVIREEAGITSSDLVLCDIANLLDRERGEHDLLSRFGECVFTLLVQSADKEKLQATSEKLLQKVAGHLTEIDGRAFTMTTSIGVCEISVHATDAQRIISFADMACEVARTSGGNQIHTHSTAVEESLSGDLEHDADLVIRESIDNERFYLVFQPIVSLKGGTTHHYEILLRIIDADEHVILPGQFLAIAERCGLATEIDRWVIDKAFSTMAERGEDDEITFYIKLTGPTMADAETIKWIGSKIKEYQLNSNNIVFEIPEACAANDLVNAKNFSAAMQSLHCKVALEHFGLADHAKLLQHFPADIVKIDGSLIENVASDKDIQAKVKAITIMTRDEEKVCIAEHVDNANALALLWQYGVDYIQGYFVQEPDKELSYEFESEIV